MVDLAAVEGEIQTLRTLIRSYSYNDVYNMDAISCFYNNVPRGYLCIHKVPSLKQDKSRHTLAVCTNATGTDKMPLLFIGKSKVPRWLKKKAADTLYASTSRAWTTTKTFQTLILVDNASSHSDEGITLTNIRVAKLPPNTTSKLQPLDQGIIYCIKRDVLRKKMEYAMEAVDDGVVYPYKVGALKDTEWCAESWRELSAKTIEHCWLHSTLIAKTDMNYILQ